MSPTCETCAHGDKDSEDEPCNRCAVVDGLGSRYPVRWEAKAPVPARRDSHAPCSSCQSPPAAPCYEWCRKRQSPRV